MEETTVLWHWGPYDVNAKTLIMTWITMLAVIIFCFAATRKISQNRPRGAQNVLEWVFEFIRGLITENMDWKKGASLYTYLVTLIIFVLFSNMLGLFPNITFHLFDNVKTWKLDEIFTGPILMSPTADVNTTAGLAILSIVLSIIYGIIYQRGHYFKHFLEPYPPFIIIHLVEMITKPLTLAMRLFGNIFAGELLIKVIVTAMPMIALWCGGFLLDTIWIGFSVFVGVIQSFIFTVLTIVYVSQTVGSAEH